MMIKKKCWKSETQKQLKNSDEWRRERRWYFNIMTWAMIIHLVNENFLNVNNVKADLQPPFHRQSSKNNHSNILRNLLQCIRTGAIFFIYKRRCYITISLSFEQGPVFLWLWFWLHHRQSSSWIWVSEVEKKRKKKKKKKINKTKTRTASTWNLWSNNEENWNQRLHNFYMLFVIKS